MNTADDGRVYGDDGRLIALEPCPRCGTTSPNCPLRLSQRCPYDDEKTPGATLRPKSCDHFIESADPWAGTYCKLLAGHAGPHSAHYPNAS